MLTLNLRRLPPDTRGVYGPGKNLLPRRMLLMHPEAYDAFAALEGRTGGLVYSDLFRSAESSLDAMQSGRGAQPPGYSGHNYGLAFDCAVEESLKLRGYSYAVLLSVAADSGWHCFRRDGARGREDWHFNFLGPNTGVLQNLPSGTWARAAEDAIQRYYGAELALGVHDIQRCLQKLRLYNGEVDGDLGPLSMQAVAAFGRTWNVPGDLGARFQRTLAYVAADLEVEEPPLS